VPELGHREGVGQQAPRDVLVLKLVRQTLPSVAADVVVVEREDARALHLLAQRLERSGVQVPDGTRIHVSGCVHACGKHHVADIGLQGANIRVSKGVEEAVDVYVGGKLGDSNRRLVASVGSTRTISAPPPYTMRPASER